MLKSTWMRVGAVSGVCALAGAGAGIAGSAAAPGTGTGSTKPATGAAGPGAGKGHVTGPRGAVHRGPHGPGHGGLRGAGHGGPRGRVAHAEIVVLNRAGTAYITQTLDNGIVKSVSGDEIVVTEGTKAVPYKDVTVTIPQDATVVRNRKTAKLSDLKAADRVHVVASSEETMVLADDGSVKPRGPHRGRGARGHHGPPLPGGPGMRPSGP